MVKNMPAMQIPEPGRSSGEGSGHSCQHCCLENPMDRGSWQATVHGSLKSWIRLKYNEVLVSDVLKEDSVTHIHTRAF